MATTTAVLPRVSKVVREQVVPRIPMRRARGRHGRVARRRAGRPIGRVVVLTVVSLALASAATATAFWLTRRVTAHALDETYE
ncbi:MAG TPA: hypothetical protein VF116_11390 [Ktedonobacterales bacterium]